MGSHGSSPRHGTLSDDVVGLDVVTADGLLCALGQHGDCDCDARGLAGGLGCTCDWRSSSAEAAAAWAQRCEPPQSLQSLLRAARVSVGYLGVLTRVTLRLEPLFSVQVSETS